MSGLLVPTTAMRVPRLSADRYLRDHWMLARTGFASALKLVMLATGLSRNTT
jgi:hypothetical protein